MNRRIIPIFTLIASLSATIFYFMQDNRDDAMNSLFIGLYLTFTIYLLLRILFYLRYKATINEMFFVLFVNIIVSIVIFAGPYVPLSTEHLFGLSIITDQNSNIELYLSLVSILALPFFLLSMILQIRSFTKYEFFRISPTSEKGLKAEWIALLVYFIFGSIFILVGFLSSELLSVFFGVFYLFSGLGFLVAK
jgi:hypothetical protein